MQRKLEENQKLIDDLNIILFESNNKLKKNEEDIKSLNDEISKIKNKYNIFLANSNLNTKINQKNNIIKSHSKDIQKKIQIVCQNQ